MAARFEPVEKTCVICGRKFWAMNPRAAKREYCDYRSPCRRRWNLLRERARQEGRVSEASRAQAVEADRLAHVQAKLLTVLGEQERAYEAWEREHGMLVRLAGMLRRMIDEGVLAFNRGGPAWGRREEFWWAMWMAYQWDGASDPSRPDGHAEVMRRLREGDEAYERALIDGGTGDAGAMELERVRASRAYARAHPDEWARRAVEAFRNAWRESHAGEELPDDTAQLEWYRQEAERRKHPDATHGTPISRDGQGL